MKCIKSYCTIMMNYCLYNIVEDRHVIHTCAKVILFLSRFSVTAISRPLFILKALHIVNASMVIDVVTFPGDVVPTNCIC